MASGATKQVAMKAWFVVALLTLLPISYGEDQYRKYDAAAVERFKDELGQLGVNLTSVTIPDDPVEKPPPIVTAPAGHIEGYWTESRYGRTIAAFEGIPYAQPPVGPLRFKEAQPAARLTDFKATKPGEKCVQIGSVLLNISGTIGQEDCLFINVYVPERVNRSEAERLPVMFFVHGGAFILGYGHMTMSNVLLDKDIVFVTFNYRLGPLGFFTTQDEVIPGNLGLKDQVAALRWVHENIASFGGDPNLVTVSGISAGGASADFLMVSPLTRGLMHRVITMSGSANAPWAMASPAETRERRSAAAKFWNCPDEPSTALLACLQTKTPEEVIAANYIFKTWGQTLPISFKPVIEGEVPGAFLPDHPKNLVAANRSNDVPLMTGITSEEGTLFGSLLIFGNDTVRQEFDEKFLEVLPPLIYLPTDRVKNQTAIEILRKVYFGPGPFTKSQALASANLFTDVAFLWPMVQTVQSHVKSGKSPAYVYYFNYVGSTNLFVAMGGPSHLSYGVNHGDDALYLFPFPGAPSPKDVLMTLVMTDLHTNFVRNGVPSSDLLNTKWLPVTPNSTDVAYLHIKSPTQAKMKDSLLPERWNLWKTLFDGN